MRIFYTILFTLTLFNLSACDGEGQGQDTTAFKCEASNTINNTMLLLINQARSQERVCGDQLYLAAPTLQLNNKLVKAAQVHSEDMAQNNFFDHKGSDNSLAASRIQNAGYPWVFIGENLAGALETSTEVVDALLRSPTHCATIMNPKFREMGSACQSNPDSDLILYWVQEFGAQ